MHGNHSGVMSTKSPGDRQERREPPRPVDWSVALETHGRWLRLSVMARLQEPQAVEDVMQDVALAAIAQRSPLVDPSRLAPWLHRLAVRQVLLYRRRMGRRRRLDERQAVRSGVSIDSDHDPLSWLLEAERSGFVRESLARLAARDAEVLLMKYAEDLSARQIAERLGVNTSVIDGRLQRARKHLRSELAKSGLVEVEGATSEASGEVEHE
ncbi:MAG TPA: RNA polymerase sigma factor [Isosphaeraceae bacterium]|nr:RNA polymerase sigma factor [Isosphaeraceae bacterium]